jgi:hypothetical protein
MEKKILQWVERFNNKGMSSKLYLKFLDVFISYIDMTVLYSFNGNLTVDFSKREGYQLQPAKGVILPVFAMQSSTNETACSSSGFSNVFIYGSSC